jgi:FKBP-type peptidyl-prolyl cis-trans isomerase FklB
MAQTLNKGKSMRLLAIAALVVLTTSAWAQDNLKILDTTGKATVGEPTSYWFGYRFGSDLAQGGLVAGDIKQEDMIKGFLDALAGKEPAVVEKDIQAAMKLLDEKLTARAAEKAKIKQAEGTKFLEDNKKKEGIQVTSTGLQYKVLKAGSGASPKVTSEVTVHYEGKFLDGKVFDSSIRRGQPATFPVNRVIPGWTEALQKMKVGDKWQLYIPSNLAYGEQGHPPAIGPNELLSFEVELLEVK